MSFDNMMPCSEEDAEFIEEQASRVFDTIAPPEEAAEEEELYSKAESDVFDIARREDFAAGVRLGARLMLAILDDTPAMVHPEIKE